MITKTYNKGWPRYYWLFDTTFYKIMNFIFTLKNTSTKIL